MIVLFNDTIHQAIKYLEENHPAEGEEAENFAAQVLADFRKRGCDNGND